MLALAIIVVACGALAGAAIFELTWTGTVLAAFVIGFAEIVVITESLSLFHAVRPATYLAVEAIISLPLIGWWLYRGRPRPRLAGRFFDRGALKAHPLILALGSVVAIGLVLELILGIVAAPNNFDSMSYHLSRAAAWYQHEALGHIQAHTERENAFPPNAEILTLFTMVFAHSDRFAALPQFVSELVVITAIFGIARRLGFRRSEAAFASLLFATLSEVVLQASTTQNDLVVAACVVASAYFLLGRTRMESLLAGLALALAVGTKLTGLWSASILCLFALVVLPRKQVIAFGAAAVVGFVCVASPVYAANLRDYGNPLGPPSIHAKWQAKRSPGAVAATFGRIFYRFIDLSGVDYQAPDLGSHFEASSYVPIRLVSRPITRPVHVSPFLVNGRANEDISYFGPLGILLVLPLTFAYLIGWARSRVPRVMGVLALALPLYVAELALTYSDNPWIGRFMLIPVALVAPLFARTYSIEGLNAVAAGAGALFLALALVHSEHKPVGLGGQAVWQLSRPEVQALGGPAMAPALEAIDRTVPERSKIGYLLGDDGWDYPLYGRKFGRRLIPLPRREPLQAATRLGLRWVVIGNVNARGSRDWIAVKFGGYRWSLLAPRRSQESRRLLDLAGSPVLNARGKNGT